MSMPAIDGGAPVCAEVEWPEWPVYDGAEVQAARDVVSSGDWWYGRRVARFERSFAAMQGAGHGVSCTNGTAALRMGLVACGVSAGDEVIVPPYTFVSTALAPMLLGAVPVFADIDLETANISPEAIARAVTPKTRAVIPVHFAGLPCDMDAIKAIAAEHDLRIVEDACHSWGTRYRGTGLGAVGDCGAFSFQMSKNMTAGEGGILVTSDRSIAEAARSYANCGRKLGAPWYEHHIVADNLRMTEVQAAMLQVQLGRLIEQTEAREAAATLLDERLNRIPGLAVPPAPAGVDRRAYHLYLFRFEGRGWTIDRNRFVSALEAEGVPCSSGYPIPLSRQPLFAARGYTEGDFPAAERLCREAVWLPHRLLLAKPGEVALIADAVERLAEVYLSS